MKYYRVSRAREDAGGGQEYKIHAKGCRYLTEPATEIKNLSGRPLSEVRKNPRACSVCLESKRLEQQVKSGRRYERQDWKGWAEKKGGNR